MTRIVHISDPHVVAPPRLVAGRLHTAGIFASAVARIKEHWPRYAPVDAVIVTGDLTDDGEEDSFEQFRSELIKLPAPVFVIPGNHDVREPLRSCFADFEYMPSSGRINWMHDLGDVRLVGLDTLIEGQGGGVANAETLAFLSQALSTAGEKPVLIAMHHPPFSSGIKFMDAIGLDGVAALSGVLAGARAEVRVICGHVHGTIVGTVGNHVAVSSAALCSAFATDYRQEAAVGFITDPGGYMVHTWEGSFRSASISLAEAVGPFPFTPTESA